MIQRPKLLIVDDEESIRGFVRARFEDQFEILEAADGTDALVTLESDQGIEVVLLDIMMPGLDGFEVLDILRAHPGLSSLRVIMLSARTDADAKVRALSAGAVDFINKPFDPSELSARINLQIRLIKAEAELARAKREAEAASRAKTEFLANMSHEIRTPLNAITGLAHMVKASGVTPQQADWLAKLDASGKHLLGIINAILDLSKIDAGRLEMEAIPFRLDGVIDDVVAMVAPQARARGLRLTTDVAPVPVDLVGDPTRLQQALLNYATNAVKFTSAGTVALRTRVLEQTEDSVLVRFEVQDSGIGIQPAAMDRLFSEFEQADNSTTRRFGGTGLGLAITRRLVERMGGEVGVASRSGQGSTFWLTARFGALPRPSENAPDECGRTDALACLRSGFSDRRILLVEDEPINREIALFLLGDSGLTPDVAEDGMRAVDLATKTAYDLILMDIQMPAMNGLDATRKIRLLPGRAGTPIVALTANAFAEDKADCLAAGMSDVLSKPVKPETLYETVLKWLDRVPRSDRAGDAPRAGPADPMPPPKPHTR